MLMCMIIGFNLVLSMPKSDNLVKTTYVKGNNYYVIQYIGNDNPDSYALVTDLKSQNRIVTRVRCEE